MKVINYGRNYEIYSDDLRTFDALPAATYKVSFNPQSGFSLVKIDDFEMKEEKIYGNHLEKIAKVLNSYSHFERSMGVILSGEKGMGKSLFVQLLSQESVKKGIPVIIVAKPFPGVAEFLESIDQEVLVIFDEFEKIFSINGETGGESQNNLLGLFDGTSQKKRLYAITVNKLHLLSEFMLSRPGRFHYHLQFDYPTADEVEVYMQDKLQAQYHDQIHNVIAFANRVKLNYDSLRAIAFELNCGYSFSSAVGDLNILATDTQRYDIEIAFNNGETEKLEGQRMNLFSEKIRFDGYLEEASYTVTFNASSLLIDGSKMLVPGDDVNLRYSIHRNIESDEEAEQLRKDEQAVRVASIAIKHHKLDKVNYHVV